jgi:hypothetical protein
MSANAKLETEPSASDTRMIATSSEIAVGIHQESSTSPGTASRLETAPRKQTFLSDFAPMRRMETSGERRVREVVQAGPGLSMLSKCLCSRVSHL